MGDTVRVLNADARAWLDEHLGSVDRALSEAGVSGSDRRDICGEVEAQACEMVWQRAEGEPTERDMIAVLADLDEPDTYRDAAESSELARASGPRIHRFALVAFLLPAALGLAVVFLLPREIVFMLVWLGVGAFLSIVFATLAIRDIRREPDRYFGIALAILGALSVPLTSLNRAAVFYADSDPLHIGRLHAREQNVALLAEHREQHIARHGPDVPYESPWPLEDDSLIRPLSGSEKWMLENESTLFILTHIVVVGLSAASSILLFLWLCRLCRPRGPASAIASGLQSRSFKQVERMMRKLSIVVAACLLATGLSSCSNRGSEMSTADQLVQAVHDKGSTRITDLAEQLVDEKEYAAIPFLISVIDADNSYRTVYSMGYHVLGSATGVEYSIFHDGAWWRRWWEANRQQFPDEVRTTPIFFLEKTNYGRRYTPFPENVDTLQGKLALAGEFHEGWREQLVTGKEHPRGNVSGFAQEVAEHGDPHAIPYLIGLIQTYRGCEPAVERYLRALAGVERPKVEGPDLRDTASWWRQWWQENKSQYPADVQAIEIPDYRSPLTFAWKEPTTGERRQAKEKMEQELLAEFAGIQHLDLKVDDNPRMRYFLAGPREQTPVPKDGFKLVVVMPGGDGSADFEFFVRRLHKYSMNDEFLVAQPIAFKWKLRQRKVWPTLTGPVEGQEFSTEEFVEAVIRDVASRHLLDERYVFTLSWSSSGPAAYALALKKETPITGSYIAMSVFHPGNLPPLANAKGRLFLLDHSPDDRVCKFLFAERAKRELSEAGATVRLVTYKGGHGWHGSMYTRVRDGISWLARQVEEREQ